MAKDGNDKAKSAWRDLLLSAGIWLGPLAWALDLGFSYSLVAHSCSTGHYYVLHLVSAVCAAIALAGLGIAAQQYRQLPPGVNEEGGSVLDRVHFMALLGMTSSVGFFILIIAGAVPRWILSPCS